MGFWDTVKKHAGAQFLDVIEWLDNTNDTLVWRFPVFNQAITDNSKLIVREGQAATFVSEGTISEVFAPGTYTLDTRNAPIAAFFESIKYQLEYPYKGDVYFTSTRQFTDNPWGTPRPFPMRDKEFGPCRIRAFGVYSIRITDPAVFLRQLVGTDGLFTTDEISGQLKKKVSSLVAATISKSGIAVLDLAASYPSMGDAIRDEINPSFQESYGITVTDLTISNIGLPEEVEKALDTRAKMGVLGDLNAYTQLKAADALETAAGNTGIGGAGVGMGVGFGMGNLMGNAMAGGVGSAGGAGSPPPVPSQTWHYNGPGGASQLSAADIASRVASNRAAQHLVWQPGWASWKSWSEVPEIAQQVPPIPSAPPPAPGTSTYHYSGAAGQSEQTVAEIVALVKAAPDGKHHVWREGFDAWKSPAEVQEIASALSAGPPPPPGAGGGPPPSPQ